MSKSPETSSRRGNEAEKFGSRIANVRLLTSAATICFLALAGCTLMPTYHQPPAPVSSSWPEVPGYGTTPTNAAPVPAAEIGWREFFRDPRLQRLIELALTNNLDLRVAMQNVEQTRALYHVQRNELIPTVDVNAGGNRQRIAFGYAGTGAGSTFQEYDVNLGVASYELDLFGRIRSLKRQALEVYLATQEAQKSAQIALVAEVAAAYLTERELTAQLAVGEQMMNAASNVYELTRSSYQAGVRSQFDLNAAQTQWQTARTDVAGYQQQLAQAENYLVLLVGCPLPGDLPPPGPFNPDICLADIPAGLPSDLLQRRPDILEAEHQLEGANANIGAARAAFFPTITLTANAGTASTTLENLFAPGSAAWLFQPQIVWPIFAAGTAWNELKATKAAERIEVAYYQKSIETAFREVADSLAVRDTVKTQLSANQTTVQAVQQNYELTQARFDNGVASSLDVLAAQQNLYNAQQNLILSEYSRLFNLINLYQALGGGWNEHTVQTQPTSAR